MVVSNDLFLIHRFPRNLGQDLKLAEGKRRSGSWPFPSTTWIWPANGSARNELAELVHELLAISDTIMFSCFHPWMECDRGLQEINACFYWTSCLQSLLGINSQDIQRTPQGPYAQEKSLSSIWHFISNGAAQTESETVSFISTRLRSIPNLWWSFASNPSTLERTMRLQPGLVLQHSTWLWRDLSQLPSTDRRNQPERCERTVQCQVLLFQNNLALFVHSKPLANFFLISFTLSTHTRTTLILLARLLGLHVICPHSFTHFLFQDLFQNQALGNAKHFHTFAQSCVPPKKNNSIALDHCNVLGMQERW